MGVVWSTWALCELLNDTKFNTRKYCISVFSLEYAL